jgi:pyruvate dehydrogenase E2 component (dihydrolipoamide acetyltransferase)
VATEVTIPNLGYTMTVAKILKWLKAIGDTVEAGEILLEIETDKVNYGIESPASGVVKAVLVKPGDEVPVGGLIAVIGRADEQVDLALYRKEKKEAPVAEKAQATEKKEAAPAAPQPAGGRMVVSPLARKMAKEKGLDLSLVKGSGRSGRIRMSDVEQYLREAKPARGEAPKAPPALGPREVAEVIQMTSMRRAIARRLSQSFHDAPHFNLGTEVDMTEVFRLLELLGKEIEAEGRVKLSVNDLLIKAVAVTLRDHPRLNSRLNGEQIEILKDINVGLAVALDDGLIVPAVAKADQKRLWQISQERKDLVERAREGKLALEEIERGTFTVSNMGMFDIVFFNSILNPPQSGILSVGKTMERPVVRDGAVVIRPIVEMTLAVDHRIVDGAVGARFLQSLKRGLENPALLI